MRKLIFCGIILLAVAAILQLIPTQTSMRYSLKWPLGQQFPLKIDGWTATDEPLGATERDASRVKDILEYSDYIYRIYRKSDVEIGVYVAYWKPGETSVVSAGGHTPDNCWVQSGWTRVGDEREVVVVLGEDHSEVGQLREFRWASGKTLYTLFWHLMDGHRTGYAQGNPANWGKRFPALLNSLKHRKLGLIRAGQYFIRIQSNLPPEELRKEQAFRLIIQCMTDMGLFAEPKSEMIANYELLKIP